MRKRERRLEVSFDLWYNHENGERKMLQIVRSKRKTLSLTVTSEGTVLVRAPYCVTDRYISEFVLKHDGWIKKKLATQQKAPNLSLDDGSKVTLFGTEYEIRTGKAGAFSGGLYLPQEGRKEACVRFLKAFARDVMSSFTAKLAEEYGFTCSGVRISPARGRWGSCNKNKCIAYSFRIAFLPPDLCEYLAVHELAHTVCFDHSSAFWRVVEGVLPDWKQRRKRLKECGFMMNFL